MKSLKNWLMEWLIKNGTQPVDRIQMGVFDMNMYYKAIRLGLLVQHVDKHEQIIQSVSLTDKGIDYVNDKKAD